MLTFQVKIKDIGRRDLAVHQSGPLPKGEVRNLDLPSRCLPERGRSPRSLQVIGDGRGPTPVSTAQPLSRQQGFKERTVSCRAPSRWWRPARDGGEPRYAAVPAQLGRPHPERGPRWPCPLPEGSARRRTATPPSPTRPRWILPAVGLVRKACPADAHTQRLHSVSRRALTCREGSTAPGRHRKSRNDDARDIFSNRADGDGPPAGPAVARLEPHPPPYLPLSRSSSDHLVSGGAQGTERKSGLMDHWLAQRGWPHEGLKL